MKQPDIKIHLAGTILLIITFLISTLLIINSSFGPEMPDRPGIAVASISDSETTPDMENAGTPPAEDEISTNYREISGRLRSGECFDDSLKRMRVDADCRASIINSFAGVLDFRKLQPGDTYKIFLDDNNELVHCRYESGPLDLYSLYRTDSGLKAEKLDVPLEMRLVRIRGEIKSSLFESFSQLAEQQKLIHAYADIFASKIDFNTETRERDRFDLVVEKYFKDDEFVGYGRILAASYQQDQKEITCYYYEQPDGAGRGYFDNEGVEIGTNFLRSPIPLGRVTSHFTLRRKHPILGVVRPHLGIDLAAPSGTPVMAVADGRIAYAGRKGGFGKQVIIRHPGGYQTHYGHLSAIGKGIGPGKPVNQKQIIGYVGSTGLSTGPHLDYRIELNDSFKNPFSLQFQPKSFLKDENLERFLTETRTLVDYLRSPAENPILQVREVTLGKDEGLYLL